VGFFKKFFGREHTVSSTKMPEITFPESSETPSREGSWAHNEGESPISPETSEFATSPLESSQKFPGRFNIPEITIPPSSTQSPYSTPSTQSPQSTPPINQGVTRTGSTDTEASSRDIQLILSKLDLISSRLENLNRRLEAVDATRKVERDLW
tara:strand:+ start:2216 stop:2674 length:459 start_codon:yes stop_codon:yes gene_type:complete